MDPTSKRPTENQGRKTMRGRLASPRLSGAVASLFACLALTGCGTLRIHRPADLAQAQQAQTQFQAADLAQAVAAERDRLEQVLAEELELVRQHTLARRDARLLYVIGEGDTSEAWEFLEADLRKRLAEFGIESTAQLEDRLKRDARAKAQKENLETRASQYEAQRESDPSLPAASCPPVPDVEPPAENTIARLQWDSYTKQCEIYLDILLGRAEGNGLPLDKPLVNGDAIAAMKAAKDAAEQATQDAEDELEKAREEYARALARSAPQADRTAVRVAAQNLIRRAETVKSALESFLNGDDQTALEDLGLTDVATRLQEARTRLSALGLDLSQVVDDLGALPAVAKLEASRGEIVAGLSGILQGQTAKNVFASLEAIGVALEGPAETPLTAMVLKEKQLDLDIAAARDREAFYDKTLALLEQQEAAYRDELAYLGQAELRRQELVKKGCLSTAKSEDPDDPEAPPEYLKIWFTEEDPAVVECKELVFRLLVQYSAAWTFGRVASEQVDYRLIALHHESALDTSDIAFQKWASLLGPPIDQLVAFSKTGIRPEDIVTPIVNAFGLGAIAAGVN